VSPPSRMQAGKKLSKPGSKKINRGNYFSKKIIDYSINSQDISSIFGAMKQSGGFESINLYEGAEILREMINDRNCTKFLSFVGAVITTCGALDHDIARSYVEYYSGDFRMDDYSLVNAKIHRLGNVLVPMENYGPLIEEKVQECLTQVLSDKGLKQFGTFEIAKYLGESLNESSFLYWAQKNNIPVIVPGIVDGAVGSQLWLFQQQHKEFKLDILSDETKLSDLIYDSKRTGGLMIGGGISKHHTLWWNQFRGGLDYAAYMTTASEWDGSLSGAPVREAVSWGKVTTKAKQTTIHGEATTLLPFLYASLIDKE
jgi:deoxyhypusine synthase